MSGYCLPISVTTSLQSIDTSRTFDFSTEHRRFWRLRAIWNATWAMRSICIVEPVVKLCRQRLKHTLRAKLLMQIEKKMSTAYLWFRVDHGVVPNLLALLIGLETLQCAGWA